MTNLDQTGQKILRFTALAVAMLGPPAFIANLSQKFVERNPLPSVAILIAYEIVVALIGFASSIYSELSKRWIGRIADALDAWLQRVISRYTREYLKYVRAAHGYVDLQGLTTRGEYTLSLADVFVSLKLDANALHSLSSDPVRRIGSKNLGNDKSIWSWLDLAATDGVPIAIIGPPGSGKTTLLKHVSFMLASRKGFASHQRVPAKIPILIALRDHKDTFANADLSLPELIRKTLGEISAKEPPRWVENQLRRKRLLIMLDGLDEIANSDTRKTMAAWADHQRSVYAGTPFVITSRPFGYRVNPLATATVLQVQPFNQSQIERFLEHWYLATCIRSYGANNAAARLAAQSGFDDLLRKLEENAYLLELSSNPLLLTMIANVHHHRGALPGSRAELYKEVCEVFLGKRHQARGVVVDMPASQKHAVLQCLAFEMMQRQVRDISSQDAAAIIANALSKIAPGTAPAVFLRRVEESSGLLLEREKDSYSFAHLTFQEYLASTYARDNGLLDILVEHVPDSWWQETIRLYSAQADATSIIDRCLDESTSHPYMLVLAVQCSEEGREVHPETRQQLLARLSPPDARTNGKARQAAGLVRLMLRAGVFKRIARDVFLSPGPVTCLEYQAFLDEKWEGSNIPDHWVDAVYPDGSEALPVTGIRYSDAVTFCEWLSKKLGVSPQLRLPLLGELQLESSSKLTIPFMKESARTLWGISYWNVLTPSDRITARSSPLGDPAAWNGPGVGEIIRVRVRASSGESFITDIPIDKDTWTVDWQPPGEELISRQLEADLIEAAGRISRFNGQIKNDAGIEVAEDLQPSFLFCYSNNSADAQRLMTRPKNNYLDLDDVTTQIDILSQTVYSFAYDIDPSDDAVHASLRRWLGNLTQGLANAAGISLNRAVHPPSRRSDLVDVRLMARLCALACSRICSDLSTDERVEQEEDANISHPCWAILRKTHIRLPYRPRVTAREPITMITKHDRQLLVRLANDFADIYMALALLEMRITGDLPAWEGFVFVRSTALEDGGVEVPQEVVGMIGREPSARDAIYHMTVNDGRTLRGFQLRRSAPWWHLKIITVWARNLLRNR